jgi:3-deoxy-D-arabino-heptulosonate 7-phosphate (DAHP) synthase class II
MHDPASAEVAAAARSNAAAHTNALRRFRESHIGTLQEVHQLSAELLRAAAAGQLTPRAIHDLRTSLTFQHRLPHQRP